MAMTIEGDLNGSGLKMAIVASRFNDFITSKLVSGAQDCLLRHGVDDQNIDTLWVPGAFEIPMVTKKLLNARGDHHAVICLGAIIRGDTPHFDFVAKQTAQGIHALGMEFSIPVLFGVLTTDTLEQAIERSGSKAGNKGWDVAQAAIEMVNLYKKL